MNPRAEYLRNWRAAYPWKVKKYNERQRRKNGIPPRPPATGGKRVTKPRATSPQPTFVLEAWPCCGQGPCTGACERMEQSG